MAPARVESEATMSRSASMSSGHVQLSRSPVEDGGNSTNKTPGIAIMLASLPSRLIAVLLGAVFGLVAVVFGAVGAAGADAGDSASKTPTSSAASDSSESNGPAHFGDSTSTGPSPVISHAAPVKAPRIGPLATSSAPSGSKSRPKHKAAQGGAASSPAHSTSTTDISVKTSSG